jgi:hypothetical protein
MQKSSTKYQQIKLLSIYWKDYTQWPRGIDLRMQGWFNIQKSM